MKTFGYAIPAFSGHVNLLKELVKSIADSTVMPDCVSISCSNYDKDMQFDVPFKVLFTYTKDHKNTGQNRNIAASNLDTDFISFIDADDLVIPERTEYLKRVMEEGSDIVVHRFRGPRCDKTENIELKFFKGFIDKLKGKNCFPEASNPGFAYNYHCAMPTMTHELYEDFKYNEDQSMNMFADAEFLYRVAKSGKKIDYVDNVLAIYRK